MTTPPASGSTPEPSGVAGSNRIDDARFRDELAKSAARHEGERGGTAGMRGFFQRIHVIQPSSRPV